MSLKRFVEENSTKTLKAILTVNMRKVITMAKKKTKAKQSRKGIKILITIAIIVAIVLIAGSLIISPPAKNLGVDWDEEDAVQAGVKLGRERVALSDTEEPTASVKFEGSHPVDQSFTSEEITAVVNTRDYKYSPAQDVQIKINDDGTGEVSGKIILANVIPFGKAFGIRNTQAEEVVREYAAKLPINPTFYVKGKPSIVNGQANFEGEEIKIGSFDVTDQLTDSRVNDVVEQNIQGVPGLSVDKLAIENGELAFEGTYPDKSMYTPN